MSAAGARVEGLRVDELSTDGPSTDGLSAGGLRVSGLTVRIGGRILVNDVSCAAPAGAVTALVGPNGAGKSTLLRALVGAQSRVRGEVRVDGVVLGDLSRRERARIVAFVEQEAHTDLALSVRDTVALGRIPHDSLWRAPDAHSEALVDDALESLGIANLAERHIGTLSGGERQRVFVAQALAQQPSMLLLDEPTNHLDVAAQLHLLELLAHLAATGLTVVTALHDLSHAAAYSQHLVALRDGRMIAEGASDDVLTPEFVEGLYGVRAARTRNPITGRAGFAFGPGGV